MPAKSIVIVNPNSKGGQTGNNWDSIKVILQKYFGNDLEFVFTEKSGDGTLFTRSYLEKGYENIIPIGGDGMINEVGNGFFKNVDRDRLRKIDIMTVEYNEILALTELDKINIDATMTILPGGTRNVLVRSLGLPSDFEECCKYLSESSTTSTDFIDIISAVVRTSTEKAENQFRIFLNAAEIGLGAEIIEKGKMIRDQISSRILSTITSVIATLPIYKSNSCQIIEGSTTSHKIVNSLTTKMTMGMVSNGSFLGGGFQAATKAEVSDGLLDTIVIKNSDSFKILQRLVNIKKGEEAMDNEEDIYYGQSQTVSWLTDYSNNITVSLDGEPVGILPAFFRVHPKCLKIKI
ncbi:diacylglycerol/lipid kinase family protein [Candidatus Nitrosocosmicus franklandus]|uniref:Putative lipid kinase n=1 Tax=Candidatus Nitrosocosmicus franklandianus TaxID=1798806 RepID=A0A484IHZ9_9ARCH|nr:diacylglycerol kinase family protein [Candidatus Nitrosocosmicus franklandus]VFJ15285.1 putative lipid kinase [Candidatus Nitrosocosmicus franklandus]